MSIQTSFPEYLKAWKWAVSGKPKGTLPTDYAVYSQEAFAECCTEMAKAKVAANNKGIACQYNKGAKAGRAVAWIVANGVTLKVVFADKAKRQQAVTQTSRDAYHSMDFTTQRGQIASIIHEYTVLQGDPDITRKEIEVWQKIRCNVVCGRVKELLEMSEEKPFDFGGKPYRLQVVSTRLSKCDGASNVPNEALRWVEVGQKTQIELF